MPKIEYDIKSLGLLRWLLAKLPCRAKKYALKWMNAYSKKHDVCVCAKLAMTKWSSYKLELHVQSSNCIHPESLYEYEDSLLAQHKLWKNMLKQIAVLENMRNVEELCIWLDMAEDAA